MQRKLLLEEILYRYGNNNNKKFNFIAPFYSPSSHSEIRLLNQQVFLSLKQKLQSVLTHNQQASESRVHFLM